MSTHDEEIAALQKRQQDADKVAEHEWECVAPPNGFYRWHCVWCGKTIPYPPPSESAFDGKCERIFPEAVRFKEIWQCP